MIIDCLLIFIQKILVRTSEKYFKYVLKALLLDINSVATVYENLNFHKAIKTFLQLRQNDFSNGVFTNSWPG